MAGMDAAIETETVIQFAIGMQPARRPADRDGRADLRRGIAFGIAAIGERNFTAQRVIGADGLGQEVDQPAYLARAIDRRWRAAKDLDPRRIGQGRGIGATIFRPLATAEIILR